MKKNKENNDNFLSSPSFIARNNAHIMDGKIKEMNCGPKPTSKENRLGMLNSGIDLSVSTNGKKNHSNDESTKYRSVSGSKVKLSLIAHETV